MRKAILSRPLREPVVVTNGINWIPRKQPASADSPVKGKVNSAMRSVYRNHLRTLEDFNAQVATSPLKGASPGSPPPSKWLDRPSSAASVTNLPEGPWRPNLPAHLLLARAKQQEPELNWRQKTAIRRRQERERLRAIISDTDFNADADFNAEHEQACRSVRVAQKRSGSLNRLASMRGLNPTTDTRPMVPMFVGRRSASSLQDARPRSSVARTRSGGLMPAPHLR